MSRLLHLGRAFWCRVRLRDTLWVVSNGDGVMVPGDQAAKLAGISRQRLYYWERTQLIAPTYRKKFSAKSIVRLYDLGALTELKVAAALVNKGVSVRRLRPFLEYVRARYEAPLRTLRYGVTRGGRLYWNDGSGWQGPETAPGQFLFEGFLDLEEIRTSLHKRVYRERAKSDVGRVVKRRNVMASAPVFEGTRVPVTAVWEFLEDGEPLAEILAAYPDLHEADIRKAEVMREAAKQARAGASADELRKRFPQLSEVELRSVAQLRSVA